MTMREIKINGILEGIRSHKENENDYPFFFPWPELDTDILSEQDYSILGKIAFVVTGVLPVRIVWPRHNQGLTKD